MVFFRVWAGSDRVETAIRDGVERSGYDARERSHAATARPSTRDTPERPLTNLPTAGRQGQQVADHPPAPLRGLALLEGEHPLEGSGPAGADREHDPAVRQSQSGLVLTQCEFLNVSELQLWEDGVAGGPRASGSRYASRDGFTASRPPPRSTRSESAQIWTRDHPRARLTERTRVDGVAPAGGRTSPTTTGKGSSAARPSTRRFVRRI